MIPIAVAIASGCEPCAESAVATALKRGRAPRQIKATLLIVTRMQALDCLIRTAGWEAVERMRGPLDAATRTLQRSAAEPR